VAELTLVGLRVVQEVAARGSFTAASEALGYTQSAVSRQVAAMEQAAGDAPAAPLRLALGPDTYRDVRASLVSRLAELDAQEELARSTERDAVA
jgi:hypothetical protein